MKPRQHQPGLVYGLIAGIFAASNAFAATPTEEMSNTVERLCPALKAYSLANPNGLTSAEKDVLLRCGELKRAPGQSFGQLSSSQSAGLQNMTSDESSVMGSSSVELAGVQLQAIVGRLATLRGATGSSVAALGSPGPSPNGSALTKAQNTTRWSNNLQVSDNTLEERLGAFDGSYSQMSDFGSKLGVFVNSSYGTGDKDATSKEVGFDFDSFGIVAGADYRLTDSFIMGGAVAYGMTNADVVNNGGSVELDGIGGSIYGTYYVEQFYVDFLAGLTRREFDTTRNLQYSVAAKSGGTTTVNQSFDGNTDAADVNLSLGTGYAQQFGKLSVTPYGLVNYIHTEIDGYTEQRNGANSAAGFGLALEIEDQTIDSLTSTLGVQVTHAINASFGVLTPYIKGDWVHEYENDARTIRASFAEVRSSYDSLNYILIPTDDPDRDYMNLGVGILAVLPGGMQVFLDYGTLLGYDDLTLHQVAGGVRFEF